MADVNYEIVEEIKVLSVNSRTNWSKQINKVSWYGREPKYDIRDWSSDRSKYGKGVTLSEEEFSALVDFCKEQPSLEGISI